MNKHGSSNMVTHDCDREAIVTHARLTKLGQKCMAVDLS